MEKGQCVQDTLPTMYGIMIAFLTCLVGYALWVSLFIFNDYSFARLSLVCSIRNAYSNHSMIMSHYNIQCFFFVFTLLIN